jgi:glutathione synthase/RimK-type ligase-like ATP-grasp enzyme
MYEALDIPMFNPVGRSLLSRRKPYQLRLLKTVGCAIPPTLITNEALVAQQFIEQHGACIMKPAAGGSLTLSANELLATGALHRLEAAPAILQKRIYGEDLRVMLVDGTVVSCAAIGVPQDILDFRADSLYQKGDIQYRKLDLPLEIQLQCSKAAHVLGLRFAGIDLKLTPEGEFYMLECNSSPIYLDVERKLNHPITQRLGDALLSAANRLNPLAAYAPF